MLQMALLVGSVPNQNLFSITQSLLLACEIWFIVLLKNLTFWKYTTRISLIFEALRRLSGEIRTVSVQNPVSEHNLVLGAKQELPLGQDHSSKIAQNSPLQQGVSMKPE